MQNQQTLWLTSTECCSLTSSQWVQFPPTHWWCRKCAVSAGQPTCLQPLRQDKGDGRLKRGFSPAGSMVMAETTGNENACFVCQQTQYNECTNNHQVSSLLSRRFHSKLLVEPNPDLLMFNIVAMWQLLIRQVWWSGLMGAKELQMIWYENVSAQYHCGIKETLTGVICSPDLFFMC